VTPDSGGSATYFPERYLAQWFRDRGAEVPVYAFDRTGVRPLRDAYRALDDLLDLDAIILVDGGTDSLMRGDEAGLGTPQEDAASLAAVDGVEVGRKLLVCLGFGIDTYHGVCHAQFLEGVAELTRAGAFLGAFALTADMPEVEHYRAATRAAFEAMPHHPSIVSSSILSALDGHFGDHHATHRTAGSKLWINPLMTLYWCFRLGPVARRLLYLDQIRETGTWQGIELALLQFRSECRGLIRPWVEMPV